MGDEMMVTITGDGSFETPDEKRLASRHPYLVTRNRHPYSSPVSKL